MTIITDNSSVFVVTRSGALYACGYNDYGQLGLGDSEDRSTLRMVSLNEKVKTVIINSQSAYVVTVSGALYACGRNKYSQLGLGDNVPRTVLALVTY